MSNFAADEGTLASNLSNGRKSASQQSTPDMTHTNQEEIAPVPYVPDNALASSPDLRKQIRQGANHLPHPYVDEYATYTAQPVMGGSSNHHGVSTPNRVPSPNAFGETQASDASYGGNPFVPSDDEKTKPRRVKASGSPRGGEGTNNGHSGTTPQHLLLQSDFDADNLGGAAAGMGFNDHAFGEDVVDDDPFQAGPTLKKTATALQDDPFTDAGYQRNLLLHSSEGGERDAASKTTVQRQQQQQNNNATVVVDDPFANVKPLRRGEDDDDAANALAIGEGRGGTGRHGSGSEYTSELGSKNTSSIKRRPSQFAMQDNQQQRLDGGKSANPRRKSVAIALAQAKPKESVKTESIHPIEVVSTLPIDNNAARRATNAFNEHAPVGEHEGEYSAEDKASVDKAAEQLFMPSMKREQYIPVRVAREKIKLVLAEMAQMKVMHLKAVDTMEKQHQFLKAQLETACAAYCRKLTADYNNRVVALNHEYKRRLAAGGGAGAGNNNNNNNNTSKNVSPSTSPQPVNSGATTPPNSLPQLARSPSSQQQEVDQLRTSISALQAQLASTNEELQRAVQHTHECLERADEAEAKAMASEETIRAFEKKVQNLEALLQAANDRKRNNGLKNDDEEEDDGGRDEKTQKLQEQQLHNFSKQVEELERENEELRQQQQAILAAQGENDDTAAHNEVVAALQRENDTLKARILQLQRDNEALQQRDEEPEVENRENGYGEGGE